MPPIHMPFGKHRGRPLTELESSYLHWLLEKAYNLQPYLDRAIRAELQARLGSRASSEPPPLSPRKKCPDPNLAVEIVTAGLHALAKRHHPDKGGDLTTMQTLNAVADWLKARTR